jgi:hypothetical protein
VQSWYGNTALIFAAQNGHQEIVRILLEKGADPNMKDQYGNTALIFAAQNDHQGIVRLLAKELSTIFYYLNKRLFDSDPVGSKAKDLIKQDVIQWHRNNYNHDKLKPLILFFNNPDRSAACYLVFNSLIQALSRDDRALIVTIDTLLKNVRNLPKDFARVLAKTKTRLQLPIRKNSAEQQLALIKGAIKNKSSWKNSGLLFFRYGSSMPKSAYTILNLIQKSEKSGQYEETLLEVEKILLLKSNGINSLISSDTKEFYSNLHRNSHI